MDKDQIVAELRDIVGEYDSMCYPGPEASIIAGQVEELIERVDRERKDGVDRMLSVCSRDRDPVEVLNQQIELKEAAIREAQRDLQNLVDVRAEILLKRSLVRLSRG